MMRCMIFCLTLLVSLSAFADKITVYRTGREVLIQSRWSEDLDIVIRVYRLANEGCYLVKRGSDIRQAKRGLRLHESGDEYPATLFAGPKSYGYISGNHGSAYARLITVPGAGFSEKDIGAVLEDENKLKYVILQVISADEIMIHPESTTGVIGAPEFPRFKKQKLFRNGVELKYTKEAFAQCYPLNRIFKNEFYIDGKTPLPDRKIVQCDFLEHRFEHDVLAPEGIVEYIKNHPGRKPCPELTAKWHMIHMTSDPKLKDYGSLPAVMTVRNKFRFQQNGAIVNERTCTFHYSFPSVFLMDQMFYWGGGKFAPAELEEFYIPKTKPIRIPDYKIRGKFYDFDFSRIATLPKTMNVSYTMTKKDVVDPANLPDRFIRMTGNGKREYGVAVGTSLFAGHTALKNKGKDRSSIYYFYTSKKMYPYSYVLFNNKPGLTLRSISYKHYFNPMQDPDLTAFYYHQQEKSQVVYIDCHKTLKNKKIRLPEALRGKKITILEKTPSVTLHSSRGQTGSELVFDVVKQGSLVLKLD